MIFHYRDRNFVFSQLDQNFYHERKITLAFPRTQCMYIFFFHKPPNLQHFFLLPVSINVNHEVEKFRIFILVINYDVRQTVLYFWIYHNSLNIDPSSLHVLMPLVYKWHLNTVKLEIDRRM